jgi:hypothetical protein
MFKASCPSSSHQDDSSNSQRAFPPFFVLHARFCAEMLCLGHELRNPLAPMHNAMELHGERVEARSGGQDQGSEFRVHLPLAPETIGGGEAIIPEAIEKRLQVKLP